MNLKEIEKIVAGIQQQLFKNSNSSSVGLLKSSIRGSGLQFKEHQVYAHGDDVRFIDWKLSAKTSQTYIKTFEEERNVEIITVVDLSPSMLIGFKGKSKLQCIFEIICLIYLLSKETNDKQRVVFVGGERIDLPPKQGKEGMVLLISYLERIGLIDSSGKVDIERQINPVPHDVKTITLLKSHIAKKKEVIYFTDFNNFDDLDQFNKLLNYKNFHCFRVLSPIERKQKIPISFSSSAYKNNSWKKIFTRIKSNKLQDLNLNKKLKTINVEDRYLEKFIKEMV
jgi:uncharacterized protein (DUF58 family)